MECHARLLWFICRLTTPGRQGYTAPPAMPLIEVEHLSKAFTIKRRRPGVMGALAALVAAPVETRWAVRDVSFGVEAGEIVGYIGPNGAGKSTTVKMLTGILGPTEGRVSLVGRAP